MAGQMKAAVGLGPDEALEVLREWAADRGRLQVIALRPAVNAHYQDADETLRPGGHLNWLRRYDGAAARWDLVLTVDGRTAVCLETTRAHAAADDQQTNPEGATDGLEDETAMGAAPEPLG